MFKLMKNVLTAIVLLLIVNSASPAQTASPSAQSNPEDSFVTEKSFKSNVFEAKYRDANSLAKVLRQLGSGFKGASISANSEFKTLTVRDFPENLATMEEALKRLDTPAPPPANIELHMHVLLASNSASA